MQLYPGTTMAALDSFRVLPCRVSPIAQATGRIQRLACTVQVGPFTEQTVDALVSAIGVYFSRYSLAQDSWHTAHTGMHQEKFTTARRMTAYIHGRRIPTDHR